MKNFAPDTDNGFSDKEGSGADLLAAVTRKLEEKIVLGQLNPRERLIEDELCEEFSCKRHVVRQALIALENLGLVERIRNRGAVVRAYTAQEVEDINAVRELIEGHAATLIPLPLSEEALQELEHIQSRHSAAIASDDQRNVFRINIEFHRSLFSHCGNPALVEAIDIFAQKSHAYRSVFVTQKEYLEWAASEHRTMIAACRTGDRDLLVAACARHLAPAKDYYIATWRKRFGE
ncbi:MULTISPECIES: GntR family transcriptional regulator [unclassified Yoonia]|uniref:GntR family transcriptional regulator n=1 Tax=unclassified Yoonia TaxID=2629118 RepID=UPI002AFE7410|nr:MULTISPECIES: GntR family transcriptional regulator [unclassified Yoonia]